jgi:RNA polymerase sigma-70 factor (ECF subfamily)
VPVDELTSLLLDARDGDRFALAAAIRASQADVWRFVAHLAGRDVADDVTQDTYVRAWRALPAFRGESTARTWLLAIARRACSDANRRRRRERRLAQRANEVHGARATRGPEDRISLELVVAGLRPERRDAFVLTQLLGCSYEEAAAACGVPVGTIRSRVARARSDLTTALRAAEAI